MDMDTSPLILEMYKLDIAFHFNIENASLNVAAPFNI